MQYIIGFLFRGPWVIQLVVAGLIAWGGVQMHRDNAELYAVQTGMIAAPPPEVTEIAAFVPRREGQRLVEARVLAQMDLDATTRLIKKTNGITTSEEVMFVLLASDAGAETRKARAVMLVDPEDEERFREWLLARAVGFGARGPLVLVEGVVSQSGSSLTAEALEDRGYERGGPDFYITPFLDGRAAGLQATARSGRA